MLKQTIWMGNYTPSQADALIVCSISNKILPHNEWCRPYAQFKDKKAAIKICPVLHSHIAPSFVLSLTQNADEFKQHKNVFKCPAWTQRKIVGLTFAINWKWYAIFWAWAITFNKIISTKLLQNSSQIAN